MRRILAANDSASTRSGPATSKSRNVAHVTDDGPSSGRQWEYRFSRPLHDEEIEVRDFDSDDAAEAYARELSTSQEIPIVIERHGFVEWEYVTEVDERP